MSIRSRAVVTAAFACAPLVLVSACGNGGGTANGARSTLQYVPATNYVVKEPPTTTTTTTTLPSEQTGVSTSEQEYEIQAGDGLFAIANDFGVEMQALCDYNQWDQCGGDVLLLPGETILIPPDSNVLSDDADDGETAEGATTETDSIDEADDGAQTTEPAEGEVGCEHTVVQGDNPSRLASQYGVTVAELTNVNLDNPNWNVFLPGETINIPANGDC